MRRNRRRKEGMTLVELIVSLALMSILMAMVVGVVSPAAKTFARVQRLQFGQLIIDNVEDEIRSQLQEATDSIKIYDVSGDGNVAGRSGSGSGAILEYVNTDSYVTLISADGCKETTLMRSGQEIGTEKAASGRLLVRYYWQKQAASGGNPYKYDYAEGSRPVARALQQVFSDKYYMGNYLALAFSFPDGVNTGDETDYIKVHVALYRDEARTDLLTEEDFIAELRYKAKRVDAATAEAAPAQTVTP